MCIRDRLSAIRYPHAGAPLINYDSPRAIENPNFSSSKDCGYPLLFCQEQLDKFVTMIDTIKPTSRVFAIGSSLDILTRLVYNWAEQYKFALDRSNEEMKHGSSEDDS